jgi:ClpP class serine protease
MIRDDLTYAMNAGRPMLIDPLKFKAFFDNANLVLSNPEIAYHLSAWSDKYLSKKNGRRSRNQTQAAPWNDPSDDADIENMFSCCNEPTIDDGMGVICVKGVIGKGLTKVEQMLGCCDIDGISSVLDAWENNSQVQEVVFKFDSGGGSTQGLEEMAYKIKNYKKPTVAYCDTDCGSAAYWLASQCDRVLVTPSSSIGSVGIYVTIKDETAKHKEDGVKYVIIKSGEYKAANVENTGLTALQEQRLRDEVVELHNRFIRDVTSVRIFVDIANLQGQAFYGDEAVKNGMASSLVYDWKQAIKEIKQYRLIRAQTLISDLSNPSVITASYPSV